MNIRKNPCLIENYCYGFNGMEMDDEVKGNGNSYDYINRFYDSRLGRFLSVDGLAHEYPWNSTYAFAENDVIRCVDLDGFEKLTMNVTSNPNSVTGEPGKATIAVSKTYKIVTSGIASLDQIHKINASEFSNLYKKGNTKLFVSELPSNENEAKFLSRKQEKLARKALKGDLKSAEKLKASGINYYVLDIQYDYRLIIEENTTICDALNWMSEDPAERGIIGLGADIKNLFSAIEPSPSQDIETSYFQFSSAKMKSENFTSGSAGAAGMVNDYDFIVVNPKALANDNHFYNQVGSNETSTTYTYNRAEMIVHEGGLNSTDLGHKKGYNYKDEGLSSNTHGKIYPTVGNTKTIINNAKNRTTLKKDN